MKKRTLITSICIVVALCLSLTAVTYAWLRREWKPTLFGSGIKIQTGSTLAIVLNPDSLVTEVNLIDALGLETVYLKQVSNLTGESNDFFSLYYDDDGIELKNAKIQHYEKGEDVEDAEWEKNRGYIEESFILSGTTGENSLDQYVFLDPTSFIRLPEGIAEDAINRGMLDAIRISLTLDNKTYGIKLDGSTAHTGIINTQNSAGRYLANGVDVFELDANGEIQVDGNGREIYSRVDDTNGNYISILGTDNAATAVFHDFAYYAVSDEEAAAGLTEAQKSRALCKLAANATTKVTIRIWLEGTAPGCITDISGMLFDLSVVFRGVTEPASTASGGEVSQ